MPSKFGRHPMHGYSAPPRSRFSRDYESQSLTGSRFKGTNSKDNELNMPYQDEGWTPYTLMEAARIGYGIALVWMALWQLTRLKEFSDSVWLVLICVQLGIDGLIWVLTTYWVFFVNYPARVANATDNGRKPVTFDDNGNVIYSRPDEELKLPEIRQGWFYTSAAAGSWAAILWAVQQFYDANKNRPLDCVDQRRLDRNLWLIIIACVMFGFETITYAFNFLVHAVRHLGNGGKITLLYDL